MTLVDMFDNPLVERFVKVSKGSLAGDQLNIRHVHKFWQINGD